ncbi:11733_t:CDS:1 [Funneliformis geosporum]|uniref:1620_t:CDS:1 n=1 Tax=Funneliformis geosporum TaxID=1117311 RepID=A0A9W4SEA0_9GLOM|nr:1620_t:CDS:1 [Funneliformis geosporum]CAI2167232.1 11733_t:CDS:1 [Funneliformis geosporum]
MPTFDKKSTTPSSKFNVMSAALIEPTDFSLETKKSSRLLKSKPCPIYTNVIIPDITFESQDNKSGIISPIPSGHLETSTRFWQFKVEEGLTTYVRYGNIRADGTLKERATHIQKHYCFGDAKQFVENLIDEKIKAGYVGWARW